MSADLIVYGLVAAGLIFWLRSILGTRHGDEKQRPNLYVAPSENPVGPAPDLTEEEPLVSPSEDIAALAREPVRGMSIENKTAENALLEIAAADKSFDIKFFLEGVQDAFALVVECFGDGDREMLSQLLSPSVYAAFDGAITAREEAEETMQAKIHAIKKAEIIEAWLDKRTAFITVRFTADETSVTRNKEGEVIAGHPDKVVPMRDIWVFTRDIKSRNPAWLVHETRGDFEGDNEIIPNSDE